MLVSHSSADSARPMTGWVRPVSPGLVQEIVLGVLLDHLAGETPTDIAVEVRLRIDRLQRAWADN
jgi:hypothetical protein